MSRIMEKHLAIIAAGTAGVSAAWTGVTLMNCSSRPWSLPSVASAAGLLIFIVLSGLLISKTARAPLRRTRKLFQSLVSAGIRDRLYVEDVYDEPGLIQLELNGLLDRLEDAMARQRQFVGAISHDIRTPLTIIKGDIEVALMRARSPEDYQEVLASNLEEVERIQRLVEDLVTLARADYGELGLNVRQVSLSSLVAEIREGFMEPARKKGLVLESYIEGAVRLSGDGARLRQLLHNLMENAVHYTPSGGRIELTMVTDRSREEVQVRVRDTGIGISPRDLPHIFEPFYRGTPSRRTRHVGYGLGLAICDHIVKAHGGRISVESRQGPGSGTTFTVHLTMRPGAESGPN